MQKNLYIPPTWQIFVRIPDPYPPFKDVLVRTEILQSTYYIYNTAQVTYMKWLYGWHRIGRINNKINFKPKWRSEIDYPHPPCPLYPTSPSPWPWTFFMDEPILLNRKSRV